MKNPPGSRGIKEYAFALLGRRDYTESRLREKLKKRQYRDADIGPVLGYLRSLKVLDDAGFAFRYAVSRISSKPRGPELIDFELAKKGIERSVRKTVLGKVFREHPESEVASSALKKKFRKTAGREVAYRFLKRRGFSSAVISEILDRDNG